MLTIEDLHVSYNKEHETLKGVSLSLEAGRVHGLVGLNGAGKTTLLNTLYGFIRPPRGCIHYNNCLLQRKEIAYLEAESYFYPYITGREYLALFPAGESGFNLEKWKQLFSLPLNDITESYSTGMRKKLALLAVLKTDKPILILDEPYNGLDLESSHLLSMILSSLREKGRTVLITSHIYETLTSGCDLIHHLNDGQIAGSYPKDKFAELQELLHATIEHRTMSLIKELLPT